MVFHIASELFPGFTVAPPQHANVSFGGYLMLKCCASDPLPNITWVRIDSMMPSKVAGTESTRLFIPNASTTDVGKYVCVARNTNGVTVSNIVHVNITG